MHITPGKTELRCIASLRDVDMRVYIKEVMKLNICLKKTLRNVHTIKFGWKITK